MEKEATISISPDGKLEEKSFPAAPARPAPVVTSVPTPTTPPSRVVRTFERDIANAMRENKGSVTSVALAEKRRQERGGGFTAAPSNKKLFIALGIGAAFTVALAGGYFAFSGPSKEELRKFENIPPPLIAVEKRNAIPADNFSQLKLITALKAAAGDTSLRLDTIQETYFTTTTSNPEGDLTEKVPTERFFRLLGARIPAILLRSLNQDFMFAVHAFNGNQSVLILKTDFYENAFLGLLNWERYMAQDLLPALGTTFTDENRYLVTKTFEDLTIKNTDVRALTTNEGKIVLVYALPRRDTIIITTSEDTFTEVLARMNAPKKDPLK